MPTDLTPADSTATAEPRPELLGRTHELAELERHLGTAPESPAGPRGRAALVAGDAGLGKTRLLTELAERARASGWTVMIGHCLDFADQLLPYLPFSEMLGRLADDDPESAARIAERHPAITALAPGRRLMSGAEPPAPLDGAGLRDADTVDRAAVFAAVHGALESLAAERPVLVVLEDLHWADRSTRDLVSFLLARQFRAPVAVVGSYRSDDLHRRHPLRTVVSEWVRLPGVLRMQLTPLPDDVVRHLVLTLQPGRLRERDVAWVVERAEGNAFFAEELVGARSVDHGSALPEDLADLLLVRLDRLDDASRQVVRAAACAGRRVTHALLAAVVELPQDELEQGVRTAVESHVLVRVGADSFAFRHALLAEAVYGDLLPGERVRLHGRYVDALTSGVVDATAAELATHARAAHDTETAIRAGVRAGEEAMAVGGPDDAAEHFEAVLELLARPGTPVPDGVDPVTLVRRTSEAVVASGHPGRAMALVRDHLDQAPPALDPRDRARLLLAWAAAAVVNESRKDPTVATAEALRLIGEEPGRLRTRALSLHARCLADEGRDEEAAKFAGEALAMAQRFELHQTAAEAATTIAALDGRLGHLDSAVRALEGVVAAAREAGNTEAEMRGRFHLALIELEEGRLAAAQELFREAAAAATASGRPWAPYGFDARYQQAMTAYLRGRWDEALDIANPAGEAPPADAEALLVTFRMMVGAGRGDESVLRHYEPLKASWPREALVAVSAGAAAIELLGAQGDLTGVWRVHDEVVASAEATWNPEFQARARLSALVLGQLADAAGPRGVDRTAPAGQRAETMRRAGELLDVVDRIHRAVNARPRGFGPEGRAWVTRAHAEHLRLRWLGGSDSPPDEELLAAWRGTVEAFDEFGHRHEAARSRARLASVLVAAGRAAEATPLVAEARAVAEELGAAPLLAELDALGTRERSVPSRVETDLTPRESEILALVADGRSNGEIGKHLFISTKTVSVHVSNILAKLGASGRTEAAAIARRRGLLPD